MINKPGSYQISPDSDDYTPWWVRFEEDGCMDLWRGKPQKRRTNLVATLDADDLPALVKLLIERLPLEALGGI
jgi:hypothetical protein